MHIFVQNFSSKTIQLDVEPSDTIQKVKVAIQEKMGIKPEHQQLLFSGTELVTKKRISDYAIVDDSRIDLVPLYPEVGVDEGATQNAKDFISFHSNCKEWMTDLLVSNGTLIEEKEKWKKFSYSLTEQIVQIKKSNKQTETELQLTKEDLQWTKEELQRTREDLQRAKEELQKTKEVLNTTNDELHATNEGLTKVKTVLDSHLSECDVKMEKLMNLFNKNKLNGLEAK